LIEEALQEFPRAFVADIPVRVDDMDLWLKLITDAK
jgi:hypothetical protein